MQTILDSAHTWFFDSLAHDLDNTLEIRLTEGIKNPDRKVIDVSGSALGPYFPVTVEKFSRCVVIRFIDVLTFFVYNESYDDADPELIVSDTDDSRFIFKAETSSFRKFTNERTILSKIYPRSYQEYILWCEDRVFHILTEETPEVILLEESPDLLIERTETYTTK